MNNPARTRTAYGRLAPVLRIIAMLFGAAIIFNCFFSIEAYPAPYHRVFLGGGCIQYYPIATGGTLPSGCHLHKNPHFDPCVLYGSVDFMGFSNVGLPCGTVPLWVPCLLSTLIARSISNPGRRARERALAGQCPGCAYDLRATKPGAPCPECGQ